MADVVINGLGRIGRAALKILEHADGAEVVAVNDLVPPDNLAYLLRYDTVYGRWHTSVTADGEALIIGGRKIPVLSRPIRPNSRGATSASTWCSNAPGRSATRTTWQSTSPPGHGG
ncbi:MAG: glyceraldehyde 3-phosphate dehydrogenase NAD-binding domain-containing protein [Streptosporangiaceae bacterium]